MFVSLHLDTLNLYNFDDVQRCMVMLRVKIEQKLTQ